MHTDVKEPCQQVRELNGAINLEYKVHLSKRQMEQSKSSKFWEGQKTRQITITGCAEAWAVGRGDVPVDTEVERTVW